MNPRPYIHLFGVLSVAGLSLHLVKDFWLLLLILLLVALVATAWCARKHR